MRALGLSGQCPLEHRFGTLRNQTHLHCTASLILAGGVTGSVFLVRTDGMYNAPWSVA